MENNYMIDTFKVELYKKDDDKEYYMVTLNTNRLLVERTYDGKSKTNILDVISFDKKEIEVVKNLLFESGFCSTCGDVIHLGCTICDICYNEELDRDLYNEE